MNAPVNATRRRSAPGAQTREQRSAHAATHALRRMRCSLAVGEREGSRRAARSRPRTAAMGCPAGRREDEACRLEAGAAATRARRRIHEHTPTNQRPDRWPCATRLAGPRTDATADGAALLRADGLQSGSLQDLQPLSVATAAHSGARVTHAMRTERQPLSVATCRPSRTRQWPERQPLSLATAADGAGRVTNPRGRHPAVPCDRPHVPAVRRRGPRIRRKRPDSHLPKRFRPVCLD